MIDLHCYFDGVGGLLYHGMEVKNMPFKYCFDMSFVTIFFRIHSDFMRSRHAEVYVLCLDLLLL